MKPTKEKLLREYGDPHTSMAAKEFRRDLSKLIREIQQEYVTRAQNSNICDGCVRQVVGSIQRMK